MECDVYEERQRQHPEEREREVRAGICEDVDRSRPKTFAANSTPSPYASNRSAIFACSPATAYVSAAIENHHLGSLPACRRTRGM